VPFHDAFTILHTAALARAASFYVDRLGFEERYRFANFVLLGLDAFELGLTETTDVASAGRVALWLYSEDVDAEIDALRMAGVPVSRLEPTDPSVANLIVLAATELTTDADIAALCAALAEELA